MTETSCFEELAEERYALEVRAEEQMAALVGTLDELRELDGCQRREAGSVVSASEPRLGSVVRGWIADRLGGPGGHAHLVKPYRREQPLYEADPLARKLQA